MTRTAKGVYAYARRLGLFLLMGGFLVGMVSGWLLMTWRPVQGIQILALSEAEGAQFADPRVLSILFHKRQSGPMCSTVAQDFIWVPRTVDIEGKPRGVKDRRQLDNAVVPFMDADEWGIVSITVPTDIDIREPWYYRRGIRETCPVLPAWAPPWFSRWFMSETQFYTEDKRVNFVGAGR